MDQIYLFNTKLCRKELDAHRDNAMILANALVFTSQSHDRDSVRKKQRSWDKFIRSLDWRKISGSEKKRSSLDFAKDLSKLKVGVKK